MELSSFNIKKAFLIFRETETPIKVLIFQKVELFYILGNGNPKKTSYISGNDFPSSKNEKKTHSWPTF